MENEEFIEGRKIFIKKTIKVGNSAGVLLPRRLLGSKVKVTILNRPLNVKKDVMKILDDYLEDILGVYILNISKNMVEILAISIDLNEIIHEGKYKVNIVPLDLIKRDVKINPRVRMKLNEAKIILNKALLFELRKNRTL